MGEAADLHRGLWPKDQAIGQHFSVTESLPKMMKLIERLHLPLTYYIEGWNCRVYPETMKDLQARGAEIGFHAYQHEVWSTLDASTECRNLNTSVSDASEIGISYKGFRPPGGMITPRTLDLLKEKNIFYLSPAAETAAVVEDIAILPFRWRVIDAYFYLPSTAPLRQNQGDDTEILSAATFQERTIKAIDETLRNGGFLSLLFHPFLTNTPERFEAMQSILEHLVSLRRDVWVTTMREAAEWILENKETFPEDPEWDTAEWKKK